MHSHRKTPAARRRQSASPAATQSIQPLAAHSTAPQIALHLLNKSPTIDGQLDDWDQKAAELSVKAAHHQEETDKSARAFAVGR